MIHCAGCVPSEKPLAPPRPSPCLDPPSPSRYPEFRHLSLTRARIRRARSPRAQKGVVMIATSIVPAVLAQAAPAPAKTERAGVAIDAGGKPVAGVEILLSSLHRIDGKNPTPARTSTDAQGRFQHQAPSQGRAGIDRCGGRRVGRGFAAARLADQADARADPAGGRPGVRPARPAERRWKYLQWHDFSTGVPDAEDLAGPF